MIISSKEIYLKILAARLFLQAFFPMKQRKFICLIIQKMKEKFAISMLISNNLITDVTNEDWSCVGIGAGYTRNTILSIMKLKMYLIPVSVWAGVGRRQRMR